jgi:N6-L-threonylcarbamoyladenine synthase
MIRGMKILAIETSCDETGIALLEGSGDAREPVLKVLANELVSQINVHKEFGGVVPNLAMREHERTLVPLLLRALNGGEKTTERPSEAAQAAIHKVLKRHPALEKLTREHLFSVARPDIDIIAVTCGPGLEPALWAGIQFAKALHALWDVPFIGVDHMEGHIAANFISDEVSGISNTQFPISKQTLHSSEKKGGQKVAFPALALTVSGGHTQLILMREPLSYELLGETVDDAAGEAFDKVARLLGLPYPGGPEISRLAKKGDAAAFDFPRPMLKSDDFNFSFSGLKTAVRYMLEKMPEEEIQEELPDIAASFQQAVVDVLIAKTMRAAQKYHVKSILLGGGVAANDALRHQLASAVHENIPHTKYYIPSTALATDNGAMIAAAGYLRAVRGDRSDMSLAADGNKQIG